MAGSHTHTVMPKKLAQALMDAGMHHFSGGGLIGGLGSMLGTSNEFTAETSGDTTGQIQQQYSQQQDVYNQQQALASQLLAQTQGQGPGQQLIAQQAGNNAAQQAALMASARGASQNPALIARQAAMAGAGGQQQALNAQAALQLQSQGALAQQQSQMANQAIQTQSVKEGALASQNQVNAGVAGQNSAQNQGLLGGIVGGISGAISSIFNQGGEVGAPKKMAVGGAVPLMGIQNYAGAPAAPAAGSSMMGNYDAANALGKQAGKYLWGAKDASQAVTGGPMDVMSNAAPVSPGAETAPDAAGLTMMASQGGQIPFGQMLAGGNVPGKASVQGDSEENDTVPTLLSPGEVVIPRSIAQADDAPEKAAEFLKHLRSKKGYAGVREARSKRGNT